MLRCMLCLMLTFAMSGPTGNSAGFWGIRGPQGMLCSNERRRGIRGAYAAAADSSLCTAAALLRPCMVAHGAVGVPGVRSCSARCIARLCSSVLFRAAACQAKSHALIKICCALTRVGHVQARYRASCVRLRHYRSRCVHMPSC